MHTAYGYYMHRIPYNADDDMRIQVRQKVTPCRVL